VATAPKPAAAHSSPLPTEKTRDCTAAPISPVSGSKATIEKLETVEKVATGCPYCGTGPADGGTAQADKNTRQNGWTGLFSPACN